MSQRAGKRGANFSEDETKLLINIWGDFYVSGKFKVLTSHDNVWCGIAEEFNFETFPIQDEEAQKVRRFSRTWEELKAKIGNLKSDYTKEKSKIISGSSPSMWKYFDSMNSVLGSRDYHNETIVFDSLESSQSCRGDSNSVLEMLEVTNKFFDDAGNVEESEAAEIVNSISKEAELACSPDPSSGHSPTPTLSTTNGNAQGHKHPKTTLFQYRRRKAPHTEQLQEIAANDKKMVDILAKRSKIDEEAELREARLFELEETAHLRQERPAASQQKAMEAMAAFFTAQTAVAQQQLLRPQGNVATLGNVLLATNDQRLQMPQTSKTIVIPANLLAAFNKIGEPGNTQ